MRKIGKKLLCLALALVMVLGMLPMTAFAAEPTSGTCGDNLTWSLQNGTLTISGTGAMPSYIYDVNSAPWVSWSTAITTVIINDGVTNIGRSAFYECTGLTSVAIPDSVTNIGASAFCECTGLKSVTLGSGLTHIEESAFAGCSSLTQISIPDNGVNIAEAAFDRCGLTSVTIPGSTVLPDADPQSVEGAFSNCPNLANVTIQDGVSSIGIYAFMNSGLTSITIPGSVSSIGAAAFDGCDELKDVYFGGTEAQWKAIAIGQWNDSLLNATVHFVAGTAKILNRYPESGATYPGTMFDITFDRDVAESATTQNQPVVDVTSPTPFQIHRMSDDAVVYTVDNQFKINDFRYGASRAVLRVNPTNARAILQEGVEYYITMGAGFVKLADGSVSPEIKKGEWVFQCGPVSTATFTDVLPDAYYHDAVYWAVEKKITNGTSASAFTPDRTCTQTEILTFLWRAAGEPESTAKLPFTVNKGLEYAGSALRWACEKGMIDAGFSQTAPCTRSGAAKFIWQAAGSPVTAVANSFTDVPAGADYAPAVAWAVEKGVTNGTGTNPPTFSPDKTCTRAEIVTFLYRAYQ